MPLIWKRGENPYRVNYFGILELGPNAPSQVISKKREDVVRKVRAGSPYAIEGHTITEAEVSEAEARLQDVRTWAAEVLLIHPAPADQSKRLQQICRAIIEQTTPKPTPRMLRLANLRALALLIPAPSAEDIAWPQWEEFYIPGPEAAEDRQFDVQYDF